MHIGIRLLMGRRCRISAAISLSTLCACAAPPGVTLPFDGTYRSAVGSHSVGGAVSYTGDVWNLPGAVADVRYGNQVARDVAVTGDVIGGAMSASSNAPTGTLPTTRITGGVAGARVGIRVNPLTDYVAFTAGFGGGGVFAQHSDAMPYITGDFGARGALRFAGDRLELIAAQSLSFTGLFPHRLDAGWVGFSSTELGLNVFATRAISVGGFLTMLYAFGRDRGESRPFFVPSLAVNYRFGL